MKTLLKYIIIGFVICLVFASSRIFVIKKINDKGVIKKGFVKDIVHTNYSLSSKQMNFKTFINYSFIVNGKTINSRKEIDLSICGGIPFFQKGDSIPIKYLPFYPNFNSIYYPCD